MVKNLTLRPYLAEIEQYCSPLDRKALLQLVLGLAREVKAKKRDDFLKTVHALIQDSGMSSPQAAARQNNLLQEIELLQQQINKRIQSIEDGSYWDDPDETLDGYWDDEPDLISEDQQAELAIFFTEADQLFLHGDKKGARSVYSALFALLDTVGYGDISESTTNLREARARFARCVYELSQEKERAGALLSAIGGEFGQHDESAFDDVFYVASHKDLPMLGDVMDAEMGELPGFDAFLSAWLEALGHENVRNKRTADLFLEAAFLKDGLAAVGKLARKWKARQPEGYLYWLAQLEKSSKWQELADVCNEALGVLSFGGNLGRHRKKAAGYLVRAGKKLDDDAVILTGYRERFRSGPSFGSLMELVLEAGRQKVRQAELVDVCIFLENRKSEYGDQSLLVKALLMAGELDQAFSLCCEAKPVGWSGESTGLLYSAIFYLVTEGNADCRAIDSMLQRYCGSCYFFFEDDFEEDPTRLESSCYQEIGVGLATIDTTASGMEKYVQWAVDIGDRRINHIVSNKHRRAYSQAADVLATLAEVFAVQGEKEKARNLLHIYCRQRYNRYSAFRKEVRKSVGNTLLLKGMEKGL